MVGAEQENKIAFIDLIITRVDNSHDLWVCHNSLHTDTTLKQLLVSKVPFSITNIKQKGSL